MHELTHLMFDDILFFEKKSRIFVKDLPPVFSIFVNKPRTAELVLHGLFSYTSVYIFWDQVHKHYPNLKKTAKNRMNEVVSYIKQASKDLNNILTKNEWNKVYNIYKNICPLAERHLWEVKPSKKYRDFGLIGISSGFFLLHSGNGYWNGFLDPSSNSTMLIPTIGTIWKVGDNSISLNFQKPLLIKGIGIGSENALNNEFEALEFSIGYRYTLDYVIPWLYF